jgi:lipid-binding SYLF domain-containing protein
MKKGMLCGFGILFFVSILISGCSKPEEKQAEAPPETKQTMEQPAPAVQEQAQAVQEPAPAVQEQAAEMKGEAAEKAGPAGVAAEEKAPAMEEQAMEAKVIDTSVDVALEQFKKDIKGGEEFLQSAKGVLVFPKVIKAGFVVGGTYGEGALRIGGKTVDYYNTAAASFGFLAGAQSVRVIIVFMQDDALKKFRESKGWEAGVDGSVTLVNVGAAGAIDTTTIKDPIVGFVFGNKGLMADLSLTGSKYTKIVR